MKTSLATNRSVQQVETLLGLSQDMATIRSRQDLLGVFLRKLKPMMGFEDAVISVYSPDYTTHKHFVTASPPERVAHPLYPGIVDQYLPVAGNPDEYVLAHLRYQSVLRWDTEEAEAAYPGHLTLQFLRENGLLHNVYLPLTWAGHLMGFMHFHFTSPTAILEENYPFYKAVADQVAGAVANIRAHEEILEREQEKSVLLAINRVIAGIRSRKELFAAIIEHVQTAMPVDDTGLLILDPTGRRWQDWTNVDNYQDTAGVARLQQLGYDQLLPVDRFMEYTLHHTGVMSLAAFREQYPEHPFGPVMWEAGLREFMFTPLVTGGRTLGVLFFDAEQEGAYTPKHLALFQTIADQVAVAVANILANEDILAREREKTLLLQISEALAEARTRPELLQITLDQLRTVLPFADAGLFEVRPDGSHRDLTVDDQLDGMPTAAAISQAGLSGFLPPHPAVAEFMQEPRIRSLAWLLEHCPGHPHFPYLLGAGLRELIGGPLVHNGRPLGMLCFWAREEGFFHPRQLPLFKQLLSLVGTTMATILAHEEILARGQEKAQLLRISSALVTIQDRRQLFRVIYEDIRPIFPYESAGLFVVDPLGQTHYELTDENILDSEDERRLEAEVGRGPFPHPGSVVEYFMQQAGSALYDLTELAETHPHPQIPLMLETGYRQLIAGPLMKGGRAFGMVCFNAKQPDFYSAQDLPLFQAIAEQLAVVVANILANEEILEREREKTQLLKVSEAISTIRDAKSLFSSLSDIIQSIIAFDEAPMIFLLDEQSQYYRIFYSKVFDPSANLSSLDAWQQGKNLVATDAIATYLIKQNHALVLNLQQALEQWRDFPGKQTMLDLALRECLVAPLRVKDSLTGFLCVWSRSEGKFEIPKLNLFQAIADQVAVAVANILANEEILAREREKQQLLLISNDLANVRTREDFWPVLNRRIAHVFGESDTATLYLLKPDGRLFFAAQHKHEDFILEHPLLVAAQGPDGSLAVEGTPFEQILAADGAFTETVTQWAQRYPSFWGLEMCRLVKIEQLILAPLRYQGKTVGCWLLGNQDGYGLKDQELFQAVTDQLSVAVANILANEELASQAQEKALQVAVTEALHRGNTWETRFEALARTLQQFVPFDYAAIGLNSDPARGQVSGFRRVGPDEYQVLSMEALARVVNLPPEKFDSLRQAAVRAVLPGQPHLLAGPDFVAQNRQHPFKALLARTFKLATNLEVPVPLRQGHFLISLYSQHAATYSAAHLQLLGSLTGVFTDTVEKLLAYEEVNRLNERLEIEKDYLEEELKTSYNFEEIIGTGPQIQQAFRQVSQVAPTDATVLLLGETGTGKELFARALHNASPRRHKVLVKVNCAALPAQLIESELFGHEKGAFTGAVERRIGKFELADGGTLFLDEIGELPLELQPKLLRALQEKEIERVGGQKPIRVDVRVVAATNRELAQEVAAGRFREDLYYRLHVFPITLPALRERPDDVPLLARHFLQKFGKRFGRQVRGIAPGALQEMQVYDWPGNVRELEHLIEQSIIMSETPLLELARPLVRRSSALLVLPAAPTEPKTWQEAERDNILAALRLTGGRIRGKGGAAELLDIKANTLDSRMQKLGIGKEYSVSFPAELAK